MRLLPLRGRRDLRREGISLTPHVPLLYQGTCARSNRILTRPPALFDRNPIEHIFVNG